jgi:hypothetical protein
MFHVRISAALSLLVSCLLIVSSAASEPLPGGTPAWQLSGGSLVRGVTVGPIENSLFSGRGYGSDRSALTMHDVARMGGNWVSLTVFGRVFDGQSRGVSLTFETPYAKNRAAVLRAVHQAHAAGLRVLLVPHLWVESGSWRGELDPGDDAAWAQWTRSYARFLRAWADVAREARVEMLAVGVELRTWVTTSRAPSFAGLLREVRLLYPGLITYAANWDDVGDTVILGDLDVIGVNAFFPLAQKSGATLPDLVEGARSQAARLAELARTWHKPILFTEFGYTTRRDCAVEPWLWPEQVKGVTVDQRGQAEAYYALLSALLEQPWFAGFFVWRVFTDPDDVTQEPEWGFSPHGKLAELVLRDAFRATWAGDGPNALDVSWLAPASRAVGHP